MMPILIIVIVTSLWVFFDAKQLGVRKGLISGLGDIGYRAWFVVVLMLWIPAFPMYFYYRPKYKRILSAD